MKKVEAPETLVLIRHGESLRNKALLMDGISPFIGEKGKELMGSIPDHEIPLTDTGWEQARKTGIVLRKKFGVPDCFYNSQYLRTVETMKGIFESYTLEELGQIEIIENLFLRERDNGYAYNMTGEESKKHFPWLQNYWKEQGHILARPPGGESLMDVVLRISHFIDMLYREKGGQKVFVVSHGRAIGCLRFLLECWSYDHFLEWLFSKDLARKNCGVTVYERNPKTGKLALDYSGIYWD